MRKLTPAGVVSTIAGQPGVTGSANGTGSGAQFYSPKASQSKFGFIYLADTYNQTIRVGSVLGAAGRKPPSPWNLSVLIMVRPSRPRPPPILRD